MRAAAVALAVLGLSLTACGSPTGNAGEDGATGDSEIRAVDRPAPKAYESWLDPEYSVVVSIVDPCSADGCIAGKTWDRCDDSEAATEPECKDEREHFERIQAEYEQARRAIAPAPGSEPRVVAELDLTGGKAELIAWRTASDKLCTVARVDPGFQAWRQRLVGECVLYVPCTGEMCVETLAVDSGHFVLAGTVARTADAVDVTMADGSHTVQVLLGPVVSESERRVLMLDLGADVWRRIDVHRDGRVVDTVELEAGQAAMFRCLHLLREEPSASTDAFLECTNPGEATDDLKLEPLPDVEEEGEEPDAE